MSSVSRGTYWMICSCSDPPLTLCSGRNWPTGARSTGPRCSLNCEHLQPFIFQLKKYLTPLGVHHSKKFENHWLYPPFFRVPRWLHAPVKCLMFPLLTEHQDDGIAPSCWFHPWKGNRQHELSVFNQTRIRNSEKYNISVLFLYFQILLSRPL